MGIVFFAPDNENAGTFRQVLGTNPENVQVVEALLNEAIPIARISLPSKTGRPPQASRAK